MPSAFQQALMAAGAPPPPPIPSPLDPFQAAQRAMLGGQLPGEPTPFAGAPEAPGFRPLPQPPSPEIPGAEPWPERLPPWLQALLSFGLEQAARVGPGREMMPVQTAAGERAPLASYRTPFMQGRLGFIRPGSDLAAFPPGPVDPFTVAHEAGHFRAPASWSALEQVPPPALNEAVRGYGETLDVLHPHFLQEIMAQLYAMGYVPGSSGMRLPTP